MEDDLRKLSTRDLNDVSDALNIAVRRINIMSETASRFIRLKERINVELRNRRAHDEGHPQG